MARAQKQSNSETIREIMTADPITVAADSTIEEAARKMRDANIGSLAVVDQKTVSGILTDRDIVVRAVAEGRTNARVGDIASRDLVTAKPDDKVHDVVRLVGEKALRRVLVMDDGKLQGIVSLGDLAIDRDRKSALGAISAARPNN